MNIKECVVATRTSVGGATSVKFRSQGLAPNSFALHRGTIRASLRPTIPGRSRRERPPNDGNILLSIFPVCELLSVRLEQLESVEVEFQVRLLCLKARSREIEDLHRELRQLHGLCALLRL